MLVLSPSILTTPSESTTIKPTSYGFTLHMSLAVIVTTFMLVGANLYALMIIRDTFRGFQDHRVSNARKELYRTKRDDFRSNPAAMEELREWKAQNNDCNYKIL